LRRLAEPEMRKLMARQGAAVARGELSAGAAAEEMLARLKG